MKQRLFDRLIDANRLRKDFLDLPDCYNGFSGTYDKALIIDVVDEQPTVDAVPVVRCKDCKHLNIINKAPLYAYCGKNDYIFHLFEEDTREHFCSWGERREDE